MNLTPRGEGSLFGLCGRVLEGSASDLGCVEEPCAVRIADRADEHSVGDAGDEVADVIGAGERGHGPAIGDGAVGGGKNEAPGAGLRFRVLPWL